MTLSQALSNVTDAVRVIFFAADLNATYDDFFYARITNYVAFIGYTILIWDHIITFSDEVRFVWKGRKSTIFYLFLINRYFTPLAFIGNLTAYFSVWSDEHCIHFVRYEGSCTIIAIEVTALMMSHRIYALYKDQKLILGLVAILFCIETGVNAWLMTHGTYVPHTGGVSACTMYFGSLGMFWPSLSAWLPLLYDTLVILLTLYKCVPRVRNHKELGTIAKTGHIIRTLLKDGLMYYSVIFCVNFVLAIMIMTAKPSLKNITAQLEQLLTVAMMSRITISLKREGLIAKLGGEEHLDDYYSSPNLAPRPHPGVSIAGSQTVIHHISVIPGSHRTSLTGKRQTQTLVSPSLSHPHSFPDTRGRRGHKGLARFLRNDFSSNRFSRSFGAVDTVLSISPAHTAEAIEAERQQQHELALIRDCEHQSARHAKIPFISEHDPLSAHEAHELRTLRPSAATSGSFLRL